MEIDDFYNEWFGQSDCIVAHTSGSTGEPKEIRLLKKDMEASAFATNKRFCIGKQSVLFLPLSVDYIAGKMMCVRAILAGCSLVTAKPSNQFYFACQNADLAAIVPSQADWLIEHPQWARTMKNVIIGGAPLSQAKRNALAKIGYNAYCTYGMTETCSHVALMNIKDQSQTYRAMPGIRFSQDERGCLLIDAPAFSFGRIATNDVVALEDELSFVWLGRYDNVVNSGGVKLHPEQLEREMALLLDFEFYLHGVPDDKWGECLEMVAEAPAINEQEIMARLRSKFDAKKLPKKIRIVDALPRTSNGKIKRQ